MGFVMSVSIIILYCFLICRIIKLSSNIKGNEYASVVIIAIAGLFFYYFIENIGMNIGLLPITGIPLPFISYGGSSIITNFICIAIVLNFYSRRKENIFYEI